MQRKLGRSPLTVSAMGMGCWAIGGPWTLGGNAAGWGEVDDQESIRAVHAALDHGITFFDTAANYGAGHSERILGRALTGRRDRVVVATKFGYHVDERAKEVRLYGDPQTADVVAPLRADCEASLRRLNTDCIDLYQFHVNAYAPDHAAAVRDALEDLVQAGKIRTYGWSTDFPESARVFAEGEHCVAIQHTLNVVQDAAEMLALCEAEHLASINRGPLGMGLLTGKYTKASQFASNDVRSAAAWFREDFFDRILDNLPAIRDVLTAGGRTLAQGALAWIWARSDMTIPIPGFRTVAQVEENAGAMQFGPLSAEAMRQLDALVGRVPAAE